MRANRRVRVALVVSEVPPRPALFPLFLALRFVLADAADADTAADAISAVDELCLHHTCLWCPICMSLIREHPGLIII